MKKRLQRWSAVGALAGTAAFILLTLDVYFHGVAERLDLPIAQAIYDHRSSFMIEICSSISQLGATPVTASVVILAGLGLMVAQRLALLGYYLLAVLGEVVVVNGIKLLIARPRPTLYAFYTPRDGFSYPSGHTMGAMVIYGMLAYVLYRLIDKESAGWVLAIAAGVISALVGFAVLYIGVHYMTDVAGGYCAGAAVLGGCVVAAEMQRPVSKSKRRRVSVKRGR